MNYHEPHELLSQEDMDMHRILQSIIEEIEAVDWYYQRAAATENPLVRKFVLHNAHEEIEHALIGIEYLRRTSPVWSDMIDEYLYQDGELMEEYNEDGLEKEASVFDKLLNRRHRLLSGDESATTFISDGNKSWKKRTSNAQSELEAPLTGNLAGDQRYPFGSENNSNSSFKDKLNKIKKEYGY